jgi:hypothetical protein
MRDGRDDLCADDQFCKKPATASSGLSAQPAYTGRQLSLAGVCLSNLLRTSDSVFPFFKSFLLQNACITLTLRRLHTHRECFTGQQCSKIIPDPAGGPSHYFFKFPLVLRVRFGNNDMFQI